MKYVPKSAAKKFQNGPTASGWEWPVGDKDIDIAEATVNGDYPESGFVVNEECKELLYIISGEGTFVTKNNSVKLQPGDQVLIDKGELFRYENATELVLLAACAPAWRPEQHKEIPKLNSKN
ncbi:MAG TPA: cupin domain-containing protein [Candidatus Saccharimonadales bacterium]|nr:cupin domain-containing protein [Candidatus Saccharimonadales bacterium]